jgi:hypothetical protein
VPEQTTTRWQEIATARWSGAKVLGDDGRYAVVAQNGGVVYLAKTEQQQWSIALGVDKPELVDLMVRDIMTIVETMTDRYPD